MAWTTTTNEKDHANSEGLSKIGQLRPLVRQILPFSVFGTLWYMLIAQLSQHWAVNPQYSFGWFVPVICGYLFLRRWRSRPPAELAHSAIARWVYWIAGLALLPTWVVAQPNPDWRLISWLLAFETVALSLCAIYFAGGRSWLRHFAFSICLIFTAVPWLSIVESIVVNGLTQAATELTVAALNMFQIPAVQHGSLIEVRTGLIGIDEACSGIRSLQAALMVSLFLGELYRTSALRRSVLMLCGALIAFLCNAGRALLLAAIGAKEGMDSIANWHDPLGYAILTTCFFLIWGVAHLIAVPPPRLAPTSAIALTRSPHRLILGLGGWILLTLIGTEIWYRGHETAEKRHWSVVWPVDKKEFAEIPISKGEADSLSFNEGQGVEWTNGDGSHWIAYFFKWAEGPSRSRILAREHRPEICLPASGYKLGEDHGMINIQAQGLSIPFDALGFEHGGNKLYVFFCLWEEGLKSSERPWIGEEWVRLARLRSVLLGERNLAQQTLEIVVSGYDTPEKAEIAFRREMTNLIQTGAASPTNL